MIKVIALLARRPDLSHAEFVHYYENNHSVLIRRLLPQVGDYRRNYIERNTILGPAGVPDLDFDVITEMFFADRAAYDAMLATHAQPEVCSAIEADEANFLDRSRIRMFLVDTHTNDPAPLRS
ncbi:EthD domain-containing protein [Rhodococcus qingshengii]|uniref:EthD domain-containing protein n=1 Tax=Rhodococcus qingshengii TaxID=334542 RepID=UPI0030185527